MAQQGRGRPRKTIQTDVEPENGIFYTVPELVRITGISKHTIQARLRDQSIRGKKLGGEWRIYPDAVLSAK